jgi:hypothetical protein
MIKLKLLITFIIKIKIDDKYFIHYLENALKKPPPFAFSGTGTEA